MPRLGSTTARGYGTAHQKLRAAWKPYVDAGHVTCWRCTTLIKPGQPWHLGHDDHDRTVYRGPEHQACNVVASNHTKTSTDPAPQPRTRW